MRTMPMTRQVLDLTPIGGVLTRSNRVEKLEMAPLDFWSGVVEMIDTQDVVSVRSFSLHPDDWPEETIYISGKIPEPTLERFMNRCRAIGAEEYPGYFNCTRMPGLTVTWVIDPPEGPSLSKTQYLCLDAGQAIAAIGAVKSGDVEIPANFEDYCEDDPPPGGGGDVLEAKGGVAARRESKTPIVLKEGARDEARRRQQQQEENVRIQNEVINVLPPVMTVEDMLADCVWIASGCQVGRLSAPQTVLSFGEFYDLTACNTTEVRGPGGKARSRQMVNAALWKRHELRQTVQTRTFHAGADAICRAPDGATAINSWRPIARWKSSADVTPFLEHVTYLFPNESERETFLDWLAHIEQRPGVLPHFGWLHIASKTGTGRNWLASVLARVWRGYVAPNVDLPALLESQFNGPLAGRVLAMVDEVQEGGGENPFRYANRLKSLVNAEERVINPKYGRQYREHNACRWLVFSNHTNALPLSDTDRRWRVVLHQAAPRPPEIYTELYKLLDDAEFINSVGMLLRQRDISRFNPGERPPMTEAKRTALNASKSMIQQTTEQLIASWPADIITNADAADVLGDGQEKSFTPAMRRALLEAGAIQYGDGHVVKVNGKSAKCWILRNGERWVGVVPVDIATEVARARGFDSLRPAIDVLAESSRDEDVPNL